MTLQIDYNQLEELEEFWGFLTYNYPKGAYTEIILMNIIDDRLYNQVKLFSSLHPNIIVKKNCQFFINSFDQLKIILEYQQKLFIRYSKVCYSFNPRFIKNNNIAGGYGYMKFIDMVFLDLESVGHGVLTSSDEVYLDLFSSGVAQRAKQYHLLKRVKIHSGNGYHLLYKIQPKPIDEKRKNGYKDLIEQFEELNTSLFKVDHCVNASRCIALPFSINHKGRRQVKIVSDIPYPPVNNVYIPSIKRKVDKTNHVVNSKNLPSSIKNSLEWRVMTHPNLPQGDVNTIVLFSLKLLIREMKVAPNLIQQLEEGMNMVRGTSHTLNLETGLEGKQYSLGIIKNWCKKHADWCEKYNIVWK